MVLEKSWNLSKILWESCVMLVVITGDMQTSRHTGQNSAGRKQDKIFEEKCLSISTCNLAQNYLLEAL